MQRSVRGATTIDFDSRENVLLATKELLGKIFILNDVIIEDVVNIMFTATKDIRSEFPPVAAREMGFSDIPLLTCQEMDCENGLKLCIRIMLTYNTTKSQKDIKHVYLNNAKKLRPDLS
jgi:chorismate mutase